MGTAKEFDGSGGRFGMGDDMKALIVQTNGEHIELGPFDMITMEYGSIFGLTNTVKYLIMSPGDGGEWFDNEGKSVYGLIIKP